MKKCRVKSKLLIGFLLLFGAVFCIHYAWTEYSSCGPQNADCCTCAGTRPCTASPISQPARPGSCPTGHWYDNYSSNTVGYDINPVDGVDDTWKCKYYRRKNWYTWHTCCRWPVYQGSIGAGGIWESNITTLPFHVYRAPHSAQCPGMQDYCDWNTGYSAYTQECCAGCCSSCTYSPPIAGVRPGFWQCVSTDDKDLFPRHGRVNYTAYTDYDVTTLPDSWQRRGCSIDRIKKNWIICGRSWASWSFRGCHVDWKTKCIFHQDTKHYATSDGPC